MAPDTVKPLGERWVPALRLRRRRDYARVFQTGRAIRMPAFTLWWAPNDGAYPRLGLQVGRRAAPKAVLRNRWKRWAREVFRRHRHGWPSVDVVLVARPEMRYLTFHDFQRQFLRAMRQITRQCQGG